MYLSLHMYAHAPFTYADVNGVLSIWQNLIIITNILNLSFFFFFLTVIFL